MTAEEEREEWVDWVISQPLTTTDDAIPSIRKILRVAYFIATKATAARCVEICNQIDDDMPGCATAKRCAIDIKKEHGLE